MDGRALSPIQSPPAERRAAKHPADTRSLCGGVKISLPTPAQRKSSCCLCVPAGISKAAAKGGLCPGLWDPPRLSGPPRHMGGNPTPKSLRGSRPSRALSCQSFHSPAGFAQPKPILALWAAALAASGQAGREGGEPSRKRWQRAIGMLLALSLNIGLEARGRARGTQNSHKQIQHSLHRTSKALQGTNGGTCSALPAPATAGAGAPAPTPAEAPGQPAALPAPSRGGAEAQSTPIPVPCPASGNEEMQRTWRVLSSACGYRQTHSLAASPPGKRHFPREGAVASSPASPKENPRLLGKT